MSIACGPMTLLELREAFPTLFYPQTWYVTEAFMRTLPSDPRPPRPARIGQCGRIPRSSRGLPVAVDVAHWYVEHPDDPIWRHYLWCADVDSDGQRVYVGGVNPLRLGPSGGFQIHRHLVITRRWGVLV